MIIQKKHLYPGLMAAAMLLACFLFFLADWLSPEAFFRSVTFYDREYRLELAPYYDREAEKYYLFLPSYAGPEDIVLHSTAGAPVRFSGMSDCESLASLPLETDICVEIGPGILGRKAVLQLIGSENLPVICLETAPGGMDMVHEDKNNVQDAAATIVTAQGQLQYCGMAKLSGRGNGTWKAEKKPYNLTLSQAAVLEPFGPVQELCLLAEYSDESRMRNAAAYYAASLQGLDYASGYTHCELYINGEFMGLYGIATKQAYLSHIEADGIQAVFEIASGLGADGFVSSMGTRVRIYWGEPELVRTRVALLESALERQDWLLCAQYIDLDSLAEKYAFEEWIANYDLSFASQYFYIGPDGKIRCMLPWDYDWSLGSCVTYYNEHQALGLLAQRSSLCWYTMLLEWDSFRLAAAQSLQENCTGDHMEKVFRHIYEVADQIRTGRERDLLRWKNAPPYDTWDVASGLSETRDFAEAFRQLLSERRAFLIRYLSDPESCCCLEFHRLDDSAAYFSICLPPGTVPRFLEGTGFFASLPAGGEWNTAQGQPLIWDRPVTEDAVYYLTGPEPPPAPSPVSRVLARLGRSNLLVGGVFSLFLLAAIGCLGKRGSRRS